MIEVGSVVVGIEEGSIIFDTGDKLSIRKEVDVFAFTGMRIGKLEVINETNLTLEVKTKTDGKILTFDKRNGIQTNCEPRFACRIIL